MGATLAEKILADKVGREVTPGEIVRVEYDLVASHDLSTPSGVERFERMDTDGVADPDRIAIVPDHMVPSHNDIAQQNYTACKRFAERHGIESFYPQSETGLMHAVLPEEGLVKPGDVVVGADSHTVTLGALGAFATGVSYTDLAFAWSEGYTWFRVPESIRLEYVGEPSPWVRGKDLILHTLARLGVDGAIYQSLEFGGPTLHDLPMDDRFSMANMAIEAGAMLGLFEPDEATRQYADEHVGDGEEYTVHSSDDDATYTDEIVFDCEGLEPQVAVPNSPSNAEPIGSVAGTRIDQAVIGSCTNCRVEDLRQAATVLEGREIDPDVRLILTPGSRAIQSKAFEEGWMETFHDAGATIGSPGCGACFGEHIGVLDDGEVAISTTNRNVVGRMGSNSSEVYLANPAVAAASAVTGRITHPEEVC